MSPFPSAPRVSQDIAQDGDSEEPSNPQEPDSIKHDSAITACSFSRRHAALSTRVGMNHKTAQQPTEARPFVPGGQEYQEALAGASRNPRGDKSVEHWLYEWGTKWEKINQ